MTGNLAPESAREADLRAARAVAMSTLGTAELLALADSAPVGLFASVEGFGIVLANQRMCDITGLPLARLLGHGYRNVIHPDDRARVHAAVENAVHRTGELSLEYRVVRPDGEVRWVEAHAVRVRTDPPPTTVVGSLVDVTNVKSVEEALRQSEARFRAIVEQGFDIVSIIDRDLRVTYASPVARRIAGYDSPQLGLPARSFFHEDDADLIEAYYRSVANGQRTDETVTARLVTASGATPPANTIAA